MRRERGVAVAAQFTQAATSLGLGMVAVRALDPDAFGRFSIIMSTLLVMTGLVTGLVGDALTVLDRHQPRIRGVLQVYALGSALFCAALAGAVGLLAGWTHGGSTIAVSLAVFAFLLEDTLRRILMAVGRFSAVLVVDATYAISVAAVLAGLWRADGLTLTGIFVAVAVGQTIAIIVALAFLPKQERVWVRPGGDWRLVAEFGGWRAILGVIGPGRLWVARTMVAAAAGLSAVGMLEANRLLVAPVLLGVQGMGSAILVSYAREFRGAPSSALRAADRDALVLGGGAVVAVAAAVLYAPVMGEVILGGTELVDRTVVLGWGLTAIGAGVWLPYASLTAVAGAPRATVAIRAVDLALSVVCVALLLHLGDPAETYVWTPAILGVVVCATALVQRSVCRARVDAFVARVASEGLKKPRSHQGPQQDSRAG